MPISSTPERAIERKADDKLERSRFIERLTSAIVNPETQKSTGVVVGITGPWGSGKSSILNLLKERLKEQYPDALVVRFDPWLVSGRNDLIAEFLGELIGTINADEKRLAKFKKLGVTIAEYGAQLAPFGNLWAPGIGAMVTGTFQAAKKVFSNKDSLSALRAGLAKELAEVSAPVVVLIDELDRIEDDEIRTVAQLVRSVVDFPGISYVLAYDPERVMQALGSGWSENHRLDRGRAYLEKIVQLQIPIPVIFDNEIKRLLIADLRALKNELRLPEQFENIARFEGLINLLAESVIFTPRDVRRLIGTFHVLAGMLYGEVDWIDLLAYSALLIKAPATVTKMHREPDEFLENPATARAIARMLREKKPTVNERLQELVPQAELNDCTKVLLAFLFPSLSENRDRSDDHVDAFHERRPLLTTLRLGLLPGSYSREEIQSLLLSRPNEIKARLQDAYEKDALDPLTDRLDELYLEISVSNPVPFWQGVAEFLAKPDCKWLSAYSPMHEKIRNFVSILEQAVKRDQKYRKIAANVFKNLRNAKEKELVAYWLRSHFFAFGLHGCEKRGDNTWFLDQEQTEAVARDLTAAWRGDHLAGKLLPCRWDLQPVYTMVDMGVWDEPCRQSLDETLEHDDALDGFSLMLYGGAFTTDRATIGKMCSLEMFLDRAKSRLKSTDGIHESVQVALKKAVSGWP